MRGGSQVRPPPQHLLPIRPGHADSGERPCSPLQGRVCHKDSFPHSLASSPLRWMGVGPKGPMCNQGLDPMTSPARSPHRPGN